MTRLKRVKFGKRYPLILHKASLRRTGYGRAGFLLAFLGITLTLPTAFTEIRLPNVLGLSYEQLGWIGLAVAMLGIALMIFNLVALRNAYVQCRRKALVIGGAWRSTRIPYNLITVVQILDTERIFDIPTVKPAGDYDLLTNHALDEVVTINLNGFRLTPAQLRRRLHRLMVSPRDGDLVLMVPNPAQFTIEISAFQQRALTELGNIIAPTLTHALPTRPSRTEPIDRADRAQYQDSSQTV